MDKRKRPVSRVKKVGTGSVRVEKRGSGLSGSSPVGGSGGFFNRPSRPNTSSAPMNSAPTGYAPNRRRSSGGLGRLILMVVIGLVAFYVISKIGLLNMDSPINTDLGIDTNGMNSAVSGDGVYDRGPYAVDRTVSPLAQNKRTVLAGNGEDRVTIMVYLLGTDLESRSGMATMDLQEMMNAELSKNVNIVVQTGGTAQWKNSVISNSTNQRYLIDHEGMKLLEDDLGKRSMVKPETLTDFIKYSEKHFPADRYMLIFWDHGGGSVTGYGYDEHFKGDNMTLDEIGKALSDAGRTFDIIGFDACLMATLETAFVLEPFADYMIASEELEPGIGWYYTGWLDALSENTSIASIDLGKKLIDDYVQEVKNKTPKSQATLSLIDLAELKHSVPEPFSQFAKSTGALIETESYKVVSDSRAATKEFAASSKINQIDVIDFATRLDTAEADAFTESLKKAIKYNRMSNNITNANGLSIYFPFGKLSDVSSMVDTYEEIGMDEAYTDAIKSFANLNVGGQMASPAGGLLQMLMGGGQSSSGSSGITSNIIGGLINSFISNADFSSITGGNTQAPSWFKPDQVTSQTQYYSENMIDPASMKITEKGGERVLELTEKEWDLVKTIELSVFIDDGDGYIDLGRDNVFEYNDAGDLILEYDGTWLTLNGNVVSYYLTSYDAYGNQYTFLGRIPALLNNERVDIIVSFDQDNPEGTVMGARKIYPGEEEALNLAKGLINIEIGDQIDFLCDYYTYEGDFDDNYYLGDPLTFDGTWQIENLSIINLNYLMSYKLTDIYGNSYWTPAILD